MTEMIEQSVEMEKGCPERAVIDISRKELEEGKYDTVVKALNAALMHLEVTNVRAFISKQDIPGRWKFELARAADEEPVDVADSREYRCQDVSGGVETMEGVIDEDQDKTEALEGGFFGFRRGGVSFRVG